MTKKEMDFVANTRVALPALKAYRLVALTNVQDALNEKSREMWDNEQRLLDKIIKEYERLIE